MLKIQSPLAGNQIQRPKSGRKPLQPKNFPANPIGNHVKPKPKPEWIEISLISDSNKENHPPTKISSFDTSLAEELSAIREKLERLRFDKEKTEKMLKERDLMLEMNMKELEKRGEMQQQLEIEVDRLFRLKELKTSCMRTSSIRSLREKDHERKIRDDRSQDTRSEYGDESKDESVMQSPSSEIETV
ncbi:high mobility group B protein 6 [Cornus florida]|uniref:high mobility group B protein 6 n=1 Tax=Cornus florida TaxID=4283 RepID=UPI0028967E6C|nr:high mobility group B protein 6 [Cornus florida]